MRPEGVANDATDELRRWLLHDVTDARAGTLEEQLMQDDDLLGRLQDAEYDLIDDYACGRLDSEARARVESHLLGSVANRERLVVAQAFARVRQTPHAASKRNRQGSRRHRGRRSRAIASIAIPATLALAAVFAWRSLAPIRSAPENAIRAVDEVADITLLASAERGANAPALSIPPAAGMIRLQAEVEQPQALATYVLTVADADRAVFVARDLKLHASGPYRFVEARLPAALLGPGARRIILDQQGASEPISVWHITTFVSD